MNRLLLALPLLGLSPLALADSAQSQSSGFVEDSSWNILNRSVFRPTRLQARWAQQCRAQCLQTAQRT